MTYLWTEKYRPTSLDDYVWTNETLRAKVDEWLTERDDGEPRTLPNLLFAGGAGTGKTSLAFLLLKLLGVESGDTLYINASRERKVEELQTRIINFASTWALGDMKYVILDEADYISQHGQAFLRAEIEQRHTTVRFILCCNYDHKIIPALKSRVEEYRFKSLDKGDFAERLVNILVNEGVNFDPEDLLAHVENAFPDLRKCVNLCQQHTVNGTLRAPIDEQQASSTKDWMTDAVTLFQAQRYREGRDMIIKQAEPEEYPSIYRWLYENLHLFGGDDEGKQDEALIVVKKGLVHHALVADAEINLSATLAELVSIARGN